MGRINKPNKATPVSADEFIIYNSEDTTDDKSITLGQVATFTENQNSSIAGTKIFQNGVELQKGSIAFGQYSPLPTGIGSYIAQYTHPTYGPRLLGYNGSAYQDLSIGSMPTAGTVSIKSLANGDCNFGYNVNVTGTCSAGGVELANQDLSNLSDTGEARFTTINTSLVGKADKTELDGQWVTKTTNFYTNATLTKGTPTPTTFSVDLSTYLPNDGNTYDVIFHIGGIGNVVISSDIGTFYQVISTTSTGGGFRALIGSNRLLHMNVYATITSLYLEAYAYRRVH